MSNKCRAYSASKIGLEKPDNRKAFYAGWDAAIKQAEKQEPVAWWDGNPRNSIGISKTKEVDDWQPLYTAPPKREWQGLTDEEIAVISVECGLVTPSDLYFARAIEAKLKEKNT